MIGNQKNKDEGYVNISTKVPPNVAELLTIIANLRGMEVYELLQLLVQGFISYAKADQTVPDEFRHLYESLKFDAAWNKAYNFCSPTAQQDIAQMVLVLQQPGRKGFGLLMIDKPFMSESTMTRSVQAIYERMSELSLGTNDYIRLRRMNVQLGTKSELEAVRTMIDAQEIINLDLENAEELPTLGDRAENNRPVIYGAKTKSTKHRTPDGEANRQQRIVFDDDDREAAFREAGNIVFNDDDKRAADHESGDMEEEMGFRPFTAEW